MLFGGRFAHENISTFSPVQIFHPFILLVDKHRMKTSIPHIEKQAAAHDIMALTFPTSSNKIMRNDRTM
jgi:hypothetical protein